MVFTELFSEKPHVFLQKDHPLASKKVVFLHDLAPYLRHFRVINIILALTLLECIWGMLR